MNGNTRVRAHALDECGKGALPDRFYSKQCPAEKALELTAYASWNAGNFHAPCAIIARAILVGGSSAQALDRDKNSYALHNESLAQAP